MEQKAEYKRGINSSNLILAAGIDYEIEKDSIEMFRYNTIPYFLKMNTNRRESGLQFCYDITSKRSLEQLLEYKSLDYTLLQNILNSFDQACIYIEKYMLAENDILLKPELIFLDNETEVMTYCYLPGNRSDICRQFQVLMEYLLQHLEHKDEQAVQLAYGVYQRAAEEGTALHTVLSEIRTGGTAFSAKQMPDNILSEDGPENKGTADDQYNRERQKVEKNTEMSKLQQKEAAKTQAARRLKNLLRKRLYTDSYRNRENDFHVEEENAENEMDSIPSTVCLSTESDRIQSQFVYQGIDRTRDFHCIEGKKILGSSVEESDICIPLPMVSRVHARIEVSPQGTFLEDMNSTNGTQVNGELLKYRERRMLKKGDIISLAGENYSFY